LSPTDLAKTEDFVRKIRYFNDMVQEMRSFLGLEISDLKPCQEAERELSAAVIRCQAALATLAEAEAAVAAARDALARADAERRVIQGRAETVVKSTIHAVDVRPGVRPEYKGSLRDVFAFTREATSAVGHTAPVPPSPYAYSPGGLGLAGPEAGGILAPIPGAGALPAPHNLQVVAENGAINYLSWEYQPYGRSGVRFEIEAAVGGVRGGGGKGGAPAGFVESNRFHFVESIEGNGSGGGEYRHAVEESVGYPAQEGTPVKYRVRAVAGAIASEWSETVLTTCVNREGAGVSAGAGKTSRLLDLFFTVRRA
jgi:hypothetical protein